MSAAIRSVTAIILDGNREPQHFDATFHDAINAFVAAMCKVRGINPVVRQKAIRCKTSVIRDFRPSLRWSAKRSLEVFFGIPLQLPPQKVVILSKLARLDRDELLANDRAPVS
jgi:hypothetical protein